MTLGDFWTGAVVCLQQRERKQRERDGEKGRAGEKEREEKASIDASLSELPSISAAASRSPSPPHPHPHPHPPPNQTVLSDAVPLVTSRALLSDAPEALSSGFTDPRKRAEALSNALDLLRPRGGVSSSGFEASAGGFGAAATPAARLRRALAAAHEACEEWGAAARALAGIDVESVGAAAAAAAEAAAASAAAGSSDGKEGAEKNAAAAKLLTPSLAPSTAEKLRHCVRVAMLYLEDEDAGSAEVYVKKGAPFAAALTSAAAEARNSSSSSSSGKGGFDEKSAAAATADLGLELQYRSCAARVLDARRDFTRAAAAYATLSRARDGALGGGARAPPVSSFHFFIFQEVDETFQKNKEKLTHSFSNSSNHRSSSPTPTSTPRSPPP